MRIPHILTAILCLLGPSIAAAQSSRDFAVMGRTMWSAFECSSLASEMKSPNEQERLFSLGYKNGLTFIAALREQKIERGHLSSEVPFMALLLLEGPTPDFMLGRVFEFAQNEALNDVIKAGSRMNSGDVRKTLAQGKYDKQNCRLLGDSR